MEENRTQLILPVICTRGMVVFPNNDLTLDVGRPKSLKAIEDAANQYDGNLIFVSQINPGDEEVNFEGIYHVGTLCKIKKKIRRDSAGTIKLTVTGIDRVEIKDMVPTNGALVAQAYVMNDIFSDTNEEIALVRNIAKNLDSFLANVPSIPHDVKSALHNGVSSNRLADTLANYLTMTVEKKQKFLETSDVNQRLMMLISEIEEEKVINDIEQNINKKVRQSIDENQREFYLREKLRAIKEELGDTPNKEADSDSLRKRIMENPYPQHVKDKALDELARFEMMPPASSEANVVRSYLDWLLDTPWYQETSDNEDLQVVEDRLNEDHFGLEKPKQRILEFLAVKQMTNSLKAPIICLVGPPGVGKTSLAKSVARALDRKFVKASLGGVKDESEIRGHRRTYLGSMPGRMIQSMKKAGVINPVFLLDELDKDGSFHLATAVQERIKTSREDGVVTIHLNYNSRQKFSIEEINAKRQTFNLLKNADICDEYGRSLFIQYTDTESQKFIHKLITDETLKLSAHAKIQILSSTGEQNIAYLTNLDINALQDGVNLQLKKVLEAPSKYVNGKYSSESEMIDAVNGYFERNAGSLMVFSAIFDKEAFNHLLRRCHKEVS